MPLEKHYCAGMAASCDLHLCSSAERLVKSLFRSGNAFSQEHGCGRVWEYLDHSSIEVAGASRLSTDPNHIKLVKQELIVTDTPTLAAVLVMKTGFMRDAGCASRRTRCSDTRRCLAHLPPSAPRVPPRHRSLKVGSRADGARGAAAGAPGGCGGVPRGAGLERRPGSGTAAQLTLSRLGGSRRTALQCRLCAGPRRLAASAAAGVRQRHEQRRLLRLWRQQFMPDHQL